MKRLFVDLDKCASCSECSACCGYFYHPQNNGVASLREFATFATLCRHCDLAPCVSACYRNALERQPDGHLRRYSMRCTGCRSCSVACPFGVILPVFLSYLDSKCDYCLSLTGKLPRCVGSCPEKAITVSEAAEDPLQHIYLVGDHLAVKTRRWSRDDFIPKKK